jgi:hypothetical protein
MKSKVKIVTSPNTNLYFHNKIITNYLLCLFVVILLSSIANSKVIGVIEIFRHGSRAPPHFASMGTKYFFDSSRMSLTINGFNQHLKLGKWLRQRYIEKFKLLPNKLKAEDIKIYSTATQRTIFSLTGHMLGLYPEASFTPVYKEIPNLKFGQNPPIHRFSLKSNFLNKIALNIKNRFEPSLHSWACKLKGKKLKHHGYGDYLYHGQGVEHLTEFTPFFKFSKKIINNMLHKFRKNLPFIFNNPKNMLKYSNIENKSTTIKEKLKFIKKLIGYVRCVNFLSNKKNMYGFSNKFKHLIKLFILNKWYNFRLNPRNDQVIKIAVSKLFNIIKTFFIKNAKHMTRKKLIMFSGHDTNIIDIISNLIDHGWLGKLADNVVKSNDRKAYRFLIPKFASNILFELHEIDKEHYVRIIYNGRIIKDHFNGQKVKVNYIPKKGIKLHNFIELLHSRINPKYRQLKCHK